MLLHCIWMEEMSGGKCGQVTELAQCPTGCPTHPPIHNYSHRPSKKHLAYQTQGDWPTHVCTKTCRPPRTCVSRQGCTCHASWSPAACALQHPANVLCAEQQCTRHTTGCLPAQQAVQSDAGPNQKYKEVWDGPRRKAPPQPLLRLLPKEMLPWKETTVIPFFFFGSDQDELA